MGSVARGGSGQTVQGAGEEDSRSPRARKVSDLAAPGSRANRGGEADRGGEIGRLPDATSDVDRRGAPAGGEGRLRFLTVSGCLEDRALNINGPPAVMAVISVLPKEIVALLVQPVRLLFEECAV